MPTDLENLIEEFNCWRQRVGQGRIPNQLKQKVIELCQHYNADQLASCFGLKKETVQQWQCRANLTLQKSRIDYMDFVALSPPKAIQAKHCRETPTLTLELPNGIKLILNIGQTTTELLELTTHLAKRLNA